MVVAVGCVRREFQFHKGTIKTNKISDADYQSRNFNSIKVQLKQSSGVQACAPQTYFNSIKVQLKQVTGFAKYMATLISIP